MSIFLPAEVEAVATAKQVLADWNFAYIRKYSQVLVRNKVPTGKRSHKFYGVWYKYRRLIALAPTLEVLVLEINSALYFASPDYAAFISISPLSGVESISIRPILK